MVGLFILVKVDYLVVMNFVLVLVVDWLVVVFVLILFIGGVICLMICKNVDM